VSKLLNSKCVISNAVNTAYLLPAETNHSAQLTQSLYSK